jgi:hypothetical protein
MSPDGLPMPTKDAKSRESASELVVVLAYFACLVAAGALGQLRRMDAGWFRYLVLGSRPPTSPDSLATSSAWCVIGLDMKRLR